MAWHWIGDKLLSDPMMITNDNLVYWHIYASLNPNELNGWEVFA